MSIKHIISIFIFHIIFDIIFFQLRKSNSKIFLLFNIIPEKWKGRYIYKWLVLFPLLVVCSIITVFLRLNYVVFGFMIGFILSLCDIAFKKTHKRGDH